MKIDVTGLIDALGEATKLVLERFATATSFDARGRPVVASPTLLRRRMVVHQATRKQLERANLDHAFDWRAFYSDEELRTVHTSGRADVVRYAGERWELANLADYGTLGGMWIALGKRVE